jgi:small subunit ribosomal protein S17
MSNILTGIVTSDVANKTITVTVTSRETHPIYGKQYSVNRKYMAHDEDNIAKKGDKVSISETRPFSKRKSYKLDTIVEKSRGSIELKDNDIEAVVPKPVQKASIPKPTTDKAVTDKEEKS